MKKPLLETNPYLQDPERREKALLISAASSSAVEGIKVKPSRKTKCKDLLLSEPAFTAFVEACENPLEPNPALRELLKRHSDK